MTLQTESIREYIIRQVDIIVGSPEQSVGSPPLMQTPSIFPFAQVKKFHQSGLGNFFAGSLRRNQLRVVTIRTAKVAARKKYRTGDLSRIAQEGQFLKSGNMHALSPPSDYRLFSFLHSGQIPSNTAL